MRKKIYGFAGRKRSGKGELCDVIKNNSDKPVIILTIANYLKQLCCDILNIDLALLNERKDNGYTYNIKPTQRWFNIIHNRTKIPIDVIEKEICNITFVDVRHMLQVIGTDLIRKYDANWHCQQLENDINSYSDEYIIAIDDVRFPNELELIQKLGGTVFFIIRPNFFNISNHFSEIALLWHNFNDNNIIINDLSLELFKEYFRIAYQLDFTKNSLNPIFLSNNKHFKTINNSSYGINYDDDELLNKIITQNKNDIRFNTKGIIHFIAKNRHEAKEFARDILCNDCNYWQRDFILYNPLINENLKKFL